MLGMSARLKCRRLQVERLTRDITRWARSRDDVEAVVLVGSFARGRVGMASDVDLVILTPHFAQLAESPSWFLHRRDGHAEHRNQVPAHRYPPAQTATSKVRDSSAARQRGRDQEGSKPDTQRPAHHSLQWLAERRNLSVHNRRDHSAHKANPEADQHEREHRMACDTAMGC